MNKTHNQITPIGKVNFRNDNRVFGIKDKDRMTHIYAVGNPKSIRQSVIANWLNERKMPLEQVQLLAGHKWISSTFGYRQTSSDEQREMINRFHPLG